MHVLQASLRFLRQLNKSIRDGTYFVVVCPLDEMPEEWEILELKNVSLKILSLTLPLRLRDGKAELTKRTAPFALSMASKVVDSKLFICSAPVDFPKQNSEIVSSVMQRNAGNRGIVRRSFARCSILSIK